MTNSSEIKDAVETVKGIVEAVPVYQDVIQPAARELGVALQTVSKTLHILLSPVSGLVWGYEKIKDFVSTRVAEKLEGVPEARLQSPEPHVAGPALEALKYTGYKDGLRDMYANLLATAIDSKTAESAHPAFVEIIKQMSPDEALIMKRLSHVYNAALIDIRTEKKTTSIGHWVVRNFSDLPYTAGCNLTKLGPTYLVNLQRLGLVEIREGYNLRPDTGDPYDDLKKHPDVAVIIEQINSDNEREANIQHGVVSLTALGDQFCSACIRQDTHK